MGMKTIKWEAIGILFLLIFICLGLIIGLVSYDMDYLFLAVFAILSLAFCVILPIIQKRISIYSVMALIIGLLFLASSVVSFGFRPFDLNMSISERSKFYAILNPPEISGGFGEIGVGLLLVSLGFKQITTKSLPNTNNQVYRMIYVAQISAGIYSFCTGLYLVANGFYPYPYPTFRYSQASLWLALISLGLLILWYMVIQPLVEKKRNAESINNKSA
jgi:hypothetical protein